MKSTRYSRARMAQRGISMDEIEEAAADPGRTTYPSPELPDERVVILGVTANGRRLKIVVPVDDNDLVITVADRDREG